MLFRSARSAPSKPELLNVSRERFESLRVLADGLPQAFLIQLADTFLGLSERMKTASQTRFLLEVELIRLSRVDALEDISVILERVADLERRLGGGGAQQPSPPAPPVASRPVLQEARKPVPERPSGGGSTDQMRAEPAVVARRPEPLPTIAEVPPEATVLPVMAAPVVEPSEQRLAVPPPDPATIIHADALMTALRDTLPETSLVSVAIQDATVLSVGDNCVVFGVKPGDTFTYGLLSRPANHGVLCRTISGLLGREVVVRLELLRGETPKQAPAETPVVAQVVTAPSAPALPATADLPFHDDSDDPHEEDSPDDELMAIRELEALQATRRDDTVAEPAPKQQERAQPWRVMRGNEMREYLDEHTDTKDLFQKIKSAFRLPDSQIVLRTRA